jgi:hypothetical protein
MARLASPRVELVQGKRQLRSVVMDAERWAKSSERQLRSLGTDAEASVVSHTTSMSDEER